MRNPKVLVLDRDDALADQVRRASEHMRPRPQVVTRPVSGSAADQADLVEAEGPFDVLVAGPGAATQRGVGRIQSLRRQMPATSILLVFSERPKVSLQDIVRTGAVDLLVLPVDDETLGGAIQRALELVPAATAEPSGAGATRSEYGTLFSVASVSGGSGKTFYATNFAYFLHRRTGARTCILDLDLQFGEVAVALRLRPRYTIADILDRDEGDDAELERYIDDYVALHDTGIHVLAAPKDPVDADRVEASHVVRVLEAVRRRFDYVVVDTPPALTEIVMSALELSDEVHVLATLDVPSLRNLNVFLKTLEQLNVSSERFRLVLNKAERELGVDIDHVAKLLPTGLAMELPYAREVTKSLNLGTPVMALLPGAGISRTLETRWSALLPQLAPANGQESPAREGGLLSRMFRRSAPAARPS
jgi:pilus assembly protein CpaE